MIARLDPALGRVLRGMARLLTPERRHWAEAVYAEAGEVGPGWPRLGWLAGGMWLVVREAGMIRRIGYGIGAAAVAGVAAWAVWLSWRTAGPDPEAVTDRMRVLAGAAALVALPWAGRRQGLFGPAGGSIVARLVRVGGCAAICAMGVRLIDLDSHATIDSVAGSGSANWLREIPGLVALIASVAVPLIVRARRPGIEREALGLIIGGLALVTLILVPFQAIAVGSIALILAATSRRSPVAPVTLLIGVLAGLPVAGAYYAVTAATGNLFSGMFAAGFGVLLISVAAGAIAAGRVAGGGSPDELRSARATQAVLAGATAGAVAGLLPTVVSVIMGAMMIIGPLAGMLGASMGAGIGASLRDSRAAGLAEAPQAEPPGAEAQQPEGA